MPKPQNDTQQALIAFKGQKSHRATCAAMGLDNAWRGTIHRIIHGFDVGSDKENEVRRRLGLPPIMPLQVPVSPCPSCAARGIVKSHGDKLDCHGNGGEAIMLSPDETVTKRKTRQYSRIDQMPVSMLAQAIQERQAVPNLEGNEMQP